MGKTDWVILVCDVCLAVLLGILVLNLDCGG